MPTTLDIEDICTHDDLAAQVGSVEQLQNLIADSWGGTSDFIRSEALDDVLRSLARRVPPVFDTDLSDAPGDLKKPVLYTALASLYRKNVNIKGDHSSVQSMHYEQKARDCVMGLSPLTPSGTAPSGIGVVMHRR